MGSHSQKVFLLTSLMLLGGGVAMMFGALLKYVGVTTILGGDPVMVLLAAIILPAELILIKWLIFEKPFEVE